MSTSVPVRDLVIVMLYSRLALPNIDRNIYEYLSKGIHENKLITFL